MKAILPTPTGVVQFRYWHLMRWTLRRWLCLHTRWARLGYEEYGTGEGPLVVVQCERCGLVREVPE